MLLGLTPDALAARLESATRARMVTRVLAEGRDPWTAEDVPEGVRRRLAATCARTPHRITNRTEADDGTEKLLVDLSTDAPGREVETVLIPTASRNTVCVSSQVGCKRRCHFCLTGTMGLVHDLRADEIVLQVWLALQRRPVRNVVFMGMGEPLDNFDAVADAVTVLTHDRGFGLAPRHVTVSTVGPSPEAVRRLRDLDTRVAWSLHAADDDVRARIIGTHRHPVAALRDAFFEVVGKQPLFVEVTLIAEHNDRDEDADALVQLFADAPTEVRLNLLPMNPIGNALRPSVRVDAFAARLKAAGFFTSVRRARGDDQRSACGQLYATPRRRGALRSGERSV
ncbi:MAG: 23S rRNA (adenine(2503)-C(2))-methyltransferase RlmN [Deltaproteobacteria bacterium]|jgi:23S rRNA (adenine2503-C2)-methyltransferase